MRAIKWHLENGMNGCDLRGEVEVEDSATDEDIETAVREDMWNWLSLSWFEDSALSPHTEKGAVG